METFFTILKVIGWLFLGLILFQAYFNMWSPIFWYRKKWACQISDFFKNLITPEEPANTQHRILVQDWNDSEYSIKKKSNWPGAIMFTLQSFKKKYFWSKPAWIIKGPGTGGGTMDLEFVERCVHDWSTSYPQAEIINNCKTFKLRTRLEILIDRQNKHLERKEKFLQKATNLLKKLPELTGEDRDKAKARVEHLNNMAGEYAFLATNLNIDIALEKDKPTKLTQAQ